MTHPGQGGFKMTSKASFICSFCGEYQTKYFSLKELVFLGDLVRIACSNPDCGKTDFYYVAETSYFFRPREDISRKMKVQGF